MKYLKHILNKILIAAVAVILIASPTVAATTNAPFSEIGDYGNWMTADNLATFNNTIGQDMTEFQSEFQATQLVPDYVPIEAKIGFALMQGMSLVADMLDSSLVRFAIILGYVRSIQYDDQGFQRNGTGGEFGKKGRGRRNMVNHIGVWPGPGVYVDYWTNYWRCNIYV